MEDALRAMSLGIYHTIITVLILIVMEDALRGHNGFTKKLVDALSLNPYCNGRCS